MKVLDESKTAEELASKVAQMLNQRAIPEMHVTRKNLVKKEGGFVGYYVLLIEKFGSEWFIDLAEEQLTNNYRYVNNVAFRENLFAAELAEDSRRRLNEQSWYNECDFANEIRTEKDACTKDEWLADFIIGLCDREDIADSDKAQVLLDCLRKVNGRDAA